MDRIITELTDIDPMIEGDGSYRSEDILFIDIETTGFTARTSDLYLIGCAYKVNGNWRIEQYFSEDKEDQASVLSAFKELSDGFKHLTHFNGTTFDLPYLRGKFKEFSIETDLFDKESTDLYRLITPFKTLLNLPACRQKNIEQFLGIDREDIYTGGELVEVYKEYVKDKDPEKKKFLLLHNLEDVKGMLEITPITAYCAMFSNVPVINGVRRESAFDINGSECTELLMDLTLNEPLPKPMSVNASPFYLSVTGSKGLLKVPVYEEEMKFFFPDYENYYYLPAEDTAVHKSVSSFVDKTYREQAKASNCYIKKKGAFIPEFEELKTPFFKRELHDKEMFFELTEDIMKDKELWEKYALSVLNTRFL